MCARYFLLKEHKDDYDMVTSLSVYEISKLWPTGQIQTAFVNRTETHLGLLTFRM